MSDKSAKPPLSESKGAAMRGETSASEGLKMLRQVLRVPPGENIVEHAARLMATIDSVGQK